MTTVRLGDYISNPMCAPLSATPYARLGDYELAEFLSAWDDLHRQALDSIPQRIHPTAFIHPTAIIGDDVIIGPHAKVWEFCTVRKGSVVGAGASVGFNCEVTRTYLGEGAILGHRIGANTAIIGTDAHLSANITVAAISMWSNHMRAPQKEIFLRVPDGLYRCRAAAFGALIGDRVQTGNSISLGPGLAVGPDTRITSGVTVAARTIPAFSVVSAPHLADVHVRRQRR